MTARKKRRTYDGTARRAQAEQKRGAMLDAAKRLFASKGFDATTIAAVARAAKCSSSAVYKAFESKAGLLTAIVERTSLGDSYDRAVEAVIAATTPHSRVRAAAGVTRTIYEAEQRELAVLRGAALVAPELAKWEAAMERRRFERQEPVIQSLVDAGVLRPDVSFEKARERLWALTGRDLYRHLVIEKRWSPGEFEAWLGDTLIRDLLRYP